MRFPFSRQRKMRGKSKTAESRLKDKRVQLDTFLTDNWLKQLRENPELANQIAKTRGLTGIGQVRLDGEGDDYVGGGAGGDALEILQQAREIRDFLKEEGEGKSSWLTNIVELLKALPAAAAVLPQLQQAAAQMQSQAQGRTHVVTDQTIAQQQLEAARAAQLPNAQKEVAEIKVEQATEDVLPLSLETLVPLVELSPEEAWEKLIADGEQGWTFYLSHTPSEDILSQFEKLSELAGNDEQKEKIRNFVRQKHEWISEIVAIAHNSLANDSKLDEI